MTKENYTALTNAQLLEKINSIGIHPKHLFQYLNKHHLYLLNELIYRTNFLDAFYCGTKTPILARLYCIEHNLLEQPKCSNPKCNNVVEWRNGIHQFAPYCSLKCCKSDPRTIEHAREVNLQRYGTDNPNQLECIKQKIIKTNLKKYGVEHPQQSKQIKEKIKITTQKRYGCDNVFQSEEIREKIRKTNMKRLGCEHPMHSNKIREKMKKTCIKKYGCESALGNIHIRQKIHETIKQLYGVDNPMQSSISKCKSQQTCIEKYGVKNYTQSQEYHRKSHKAYTNSKYPNISFDNSWEFKVYNFLTEHHIDFKYHPPFVIPYEYNGIYHIYHPDFKVGNRLIEVKGDHFFRINKSTGKEEMYNPYKNPKWNEEEYKAECGKYEAKHQCMLANNVKILRRKEIQNLTIDMFTCV